MKKILLFFLFAMLAQAGQAQGTAPTTAPTVGRPQQYAEQDKPLTLQDEVEARVSRHLSHYEVMDNLTVLDTTGMEYSMIAVTKLVAVQAATEYLSHSPREVMNLATSGKQQGQPSGWSVMVLIFIGVCIGGALTILATSTNIFH
jgi:hypothetical protein